MLTSGAIALILLLSPGSVELQTETSIELLVKKHGEGERLRIERGVRQVQQRWRASDGSFTQFITEEFLPKGDVLDATFSRLEFALERMSGYANSINRDLRRGLDLEIGPQLPIDERLAGLEASGHQTDDLFKSKVAFVVLLNFPLTTLDQKLADGAKWTRRAWAETRLAQRFAVRSSPNESMAVSQAIASAESYIANYNLYTHHILTKDGRRLFPAGQRLLSHWNLRDEIKAGYSDGAGLAKQRLLTQVMEAIVQQTIPAVVINNPMLDWTPGTGAVTVSSAKDAEAPPKSSSQASSLRENDERYRQWLKVFRAQRATDKGDPEYPTYLDRRFARDSEVREKDVEVLLVSILSSTLASPVAKRIEAMLGRKLEPFDIYFNPAASRGGKSEAELDAITRKRYPDVQAFSRDIPRLLRELGFSAEKAQFLAQRIVVEPARGAGHAFGISRRDDLAHLRTRVAADGMDYKSYNIAIHEMGHNVEQLFSMATIDHTSLYGVPNSSITEALAFVFQAKDLQLLGLPRSDSNLSATAAFWALREISGASLVDMRAWRWLYAHPKATPAQFREAVVAISKDVWNQYFAPVMGVRDSTLLAIYSHMVQSALYLPDYAIAQLTAFQIRQHFDSIKGPIGPEFERMAQIGYVTPDEWMRQAVGSKLSMKSLVEAVQLELDKK